MSEAPATGVAGESRFDPVAGLPLWAKKAGGGAGGSGAFFLKSEKRDIASIGRGGGFFERGKPSDRKEWDSDDEVYDEFGRKKKKRAKAKAKPGATKQDAAAATASSTAPAASVEEVKAPTVAGSIVQGLATPGKAISGSSLLGMFQPASASRDGAGSVYGGSPYGGACGGVCGAAFGGPCGGPCVGDCNAPCGFHGASFGAKGGPMGGPLPPEAWSRNADASPNGADGCAAAWWGKGALGCGKAANKAAGGGKAMGWGGPSACWAASAWGWGQAWAAPCAVWQSSADAAQGGWADARG